MGRGWRWVRTCFSRTALWDFALWCGGALSIVGGLVGFALIGRSILLAAGFTFPWLGEPADLWAEIRNGLLIGTAGVGAPFVIWRTRLAARQTDINQETHFTDLYAKAVEMLGADKTVKADGQERTEPNIEVRLGAI